ncbi:MAG: hypothetical protein E6J70_13440 [Deltaproteobacteria bacterium]|nr:MAG: hypothetical protein E6J70_13440 [Deltaproteobacteria bacterium]
MAAQEDVVIADGRISRVDHRVDVAREDERRPARDEGDVGRVVEDGAAVRAGGENRIEREAELRSEEPVEAHVGIEPRLGDVEADAILELVRAAVVRPDLEHQALLEEGARDDVLGEDLEVVGAALEAGNEDENRIGHARAVTAEAGVGRVVQAEARATELREEVRIGHRDARGAGGVRGLGRARDARGGRDRVAGVERVPAAGVRDEVEAGTRVSDGPRRALAAGRRRDGAEVAPGMRHVLTAGMAIRRGSEPAVGLARDAQDRPLALGAQLEAPVDRRAVARIARDGAHAADEGRLVLAPARAVEGGTGAGELGRGADASDVCRVLRGRGALAAPVRGPHGDGGDGEHAGERGQDG